jgi:hypothetical protein
MVAVERGLVCFFSAGYFVNSFCGYFFCLFNMERAKPNPDFLKKDELRYEILIRNGGEQSDLKVPQLQKLLRELF